MRTIIFVVEKISNLDLIFQTFDGWFFRTIIFFLISCLKTYHDKFPHALLFRIIHMHQNYCLRRMQHSNAVCEASSNILVHLRQKTWFSFSELKSSHFLSKDGFSWSFCVAIYVYIRIYQVNIRIYIPSLRAQTIRDMRYV